MEKTIINKGIFILKSGDEFEGELKNWKLNGTIKYKFKNNDKFKGNYYEGELNGPYAFLEKFKDIKIEKKNNENKGKIMFKDRSIYEGELHEEKLIPHGKGKISFEENVSNFLSLEGNFESGIVKKGVLNFKNGTSYTGEFNSEGFYNGKGTLILGESKVKIQGEFKEGHLNYGDILYPNGDTYQGNIKELQPHGMGVYTFKNGDEVYKGNFYSGKKSGKGKLIRGNGNWVYEGDFEDDTFNGQGSIETPNHVLKGFFYDGELEGEYDILEKKTNKFI